MKLTTSNERLKQIKKAGFILKPNSPEIKKDYEVIKNHFLKANIEVILEKQSAIMIDEGGIELDNLCQICDFLVSMGGDGTLISVVRRSFNFNIPVLGIHQGTLGFLTDIRFNEVENFLSLMLEHKYRIDHRMMIKGCAKNQSFVAFNDIVITRKSVSSMISLSAKIDGIPFNSYYGDGVIISTPTGSTAYNLSVGGPIVYPLTEAFIVTPVAPHSLTQRPLVLPADFKIEFTITDKQGALVIIDGQDIYEVSEGETVKIEISANKARLIHRCQRNYFEVLNEKLRWGN
jgi:NAD+ kinase